MNNLMMIIVLAIVGLFFGLVAGIYANRSSVELREQPAPTGFWAFLLAFGAAQGVIFILVPSSTVKAWIFVAVLGLLTVFQIVNKEGANRMASWNSLAILAAGLLFFSIAGWMDEQQLTAPKPARFFFLIPIAAPFIVGAIRVATMDYEPEEKERLTDAQFKANLLGGALLAGIYIAIGRALVWIFS